MLEIPEDFLKLILKDWVDGLYEAGFSSAMIEEVLRQKAEPFNLDADVIVKLAFAHLEGLL